MPHLSKITHSNPNTAEKVNYFADQFKFISNFIGTFKEIPFENHLSLVEKSIYQIENNLNKSTPYLKNYFNHSFLHSAGFIKIFPSHRLAISQIEIFLKVGDKKKVSWIKKNPSFLTNLIELKKELETSMIPEITKLLKRILRCKHKLVTHRKTVKFCANILVTEFIYKNYSKKEIRKLISKIMSKDINSFPFPKEITIQKNKPNYEEIKQEYLTKRNFDSQFQGFYNELEKELFKSYFIFKINNISTKGFSSFIFEYNNVTFMSPRNSKLNNIKKELNNKTINKEYFKNTSKSIIAVVNLEYSDLDSAADSAREKIKNSLKFINRKLRSAGFLDEDYFLFSGDLVDLGSSKRFTSRLTYLKDTDLDKLNNNIHVYLKDIPIVTKRPLIYFQEKFTNAYHEKNIPNLWHYLENIIPVNENGNKQIKSVVSSVLLLDQRNYSKDRLKFEFANTVSGMSVKAEEIGLTRKEQRFVETKYYEINPLNYKTKINHPFVKSLLQLYTLKSSKRNLASAKEYFTSILTEAYEFRNMETHKGEWNEKLKLKVEYLFPTIVSRFRMILIDEISAYKGVEFDEMINDLVAIC